MTSGQKVLLTGIRASGDIHLGNYFGAMKQAIVNQEKYLSYLFIADLHGLTTSPPADELRYNVRAIAAAWLAAGVDTKKTILWKQSDVPEVLELAHVLTCVTTMGLLERAHSYKDALQKEKVLKAGIFFYPVLMAADILLYEADLVPVGKDQAQHLEMARDMATFFNETYEPILKLPEAMILKNSAIVPGVDGRKMSKSYNNSIQMFAPEAELKKQIMGIKTDSKGLADPKVASECVVYQLYELVADPADVQQMKAKLEAGGYGYGDAKKALLAAILEKFGAMRNEYERLMKSPGDIDRALVQGAERAREKAAKMISRVRGAVGL